MYQSSSLSEKELLNDLILTEKQLSSSYNGAILETSCPRLRDILSNCLKNTQEIQFSINKALDDRGWHQLDLASYRDIEKITSRYESLF